MMLGPRPFPLNRGDALAISAHLLLRADQLLAEERLVLRHGYELCIIHAGSPKQESAGAPEPSKAEAPEPRSADQPPSSDAPAKRHHPSARPAAKRSHDKAFGGMPPPSPVVPEPPLFPSVPSSPQCPNFNDRYGPPVPSVLASPHAGQTLAVASPVRAPSHSQVPWFHGSPRVNVLTSPCGSPGRFLSGEVSLSEGCTSSPLHRRLSRALYAQGLSSGGGPRSAMVSRASRVPASPIPCRMIPIPSDTPHTLLASNAREPSVDGDAGAPGEDAPRSAFGARWPHRRAAGLTDILSPQTPDALVPPLRHKSGWHASQVPKVCAVARGDPNDGGKRARSRALQPHNASTGSPRVYPR